MSVVAVIPARMGSKRLPAKVLADIQGKPLVVHVWEIVQSCKAIDRVVVATDSDEIEAVASSAGAEVYRSRTGHWTGTDRVAEALSEIPCRVALNVQADNAFLDVPILSQVVACLEDTSVAVATPICPFPEHLDPSDPSKVKAAIGKNGDALYFSRLPIPSGGPWWLHIGVYGFQYDSLQRFSSWERGVLEQQEDLEQLRFIENGVPIRTTQVAYSGVGLDTPSDLMRLSPHSSSSAVPHSQRF